MSTTNMTSTEKPAGRTPAKAILKQLPWDEEHDWKELLATADAAGAYYQIFKHKDGIRVICMIKEKIVARETCATKEAAMDWAWLNYNKYMGEFIKNI